MPAIASALAGKAPKPSPAVDVGLPSPVEPSVGFPMVARPPRSAPRVEEASGIESDLPVALGGSPSRARHVSSAGSAPGAMLPALTDSGDERAGLPELSAGRDDLPSLHPGPEGLPDLPRDAAGIALQEPDELGWDLPSPRGSAPSDRPGFEMGFAPELGQDLDVGGELPLPGVDLDHVGDELELPSPKRWEAEAPNLGVAVPERVEIGDIGPVIPSLGSSSATSGAAAREGRGPVAGAVPRLSAVSGQMLGAGGGSRVSASSPPVAMDLELGPTPSGRGAGAVPQVPALDLERPTDARSPSVPPAPAATGSVLGLMAGASSEQDLDELRLSNATGPDSTAGTAGSEAVIRRQSGGGTDFGEVNLDSGDMGSSPIAELDRSTRMGQPSAENLEFGAIPQEAKKPISAHPSPEAASDQTPVPPRSEPRATRPRGRSGLVVLGSVVLMACAGAVLGFWPDVGPFGSNLILDQLHKNEYEARLRSFESRGRRVLASDDYASTVDLVNELDSARRQSERARGIAAYAAYLGYALDLRFGGEPQLRARAKVILDELAQREQIPYLDLARAAQGLAEGNLARTERDLSILRNSGAAPVEVAVLEALAETKKRRFDQALVAWQRVEQGEKSARAAYGVAVASFRLGGRVDQAEAACKLALSRNPGHVGAALLLARIVFESRRDGAAAEKLIETQLSRVARLGASDFVDGKTLLGDVQVSRSRISLAETAYQDALKRDPRASGALRGLGEALYRAGRYAESMARFEAGLQADPDDVASAVGVAKTQVALERLREANALLTRLRQSQPKDYSVNYWYARVHEAMGNRDEAEKAYTSAVDLGGVDPAVVDSYVALALIKNQQGRREEAQKVLQAARDRLPRSPKIHEALGQLALAEGRYDAAIEEFKSALSLDTTDVGAKFRLGTALRRAREFDAALRLFEEVTAVDRDYPGLALERGLLFEASGRSEEALQSFEAALAKAPNDPDLLLRVGCGKVAAGRLQGAEEQLRAVLLQRPASAETHHCLGRAQLLEGSNLALALRTLQRAVELDPHRAEYHLYVGWAANEAGRVALAETELKKALEMDQGLGDAYWQRGVLRYRQGAVKDAMADLIRALELRPGRNEAHAALADTYYDLGLEQKALEQWKLAVAAQPDNATWRFRYGKLLQAVRRDADARVELSKALELVDGLSVSPRWAWEAHHLLARALGSQTAAIKHWQAYLRLAPQDNAYRDEAKQALSRLGQPWDGN